MADIVNHYRVLGCEENASIDVIKKCYHEKALVHHPDKASKDDTGADVIGFDRLSKAWKTLSDPEARRVYDAQLNESRLASRGLMFGRFTSSELTFDSDQNTYSYLCRCGGMFVLESEDLSQAKNCEVCVECDSCSLVIHVSQT